MNVLAAHTCSAQPVKRFVPRRSAFLHLAVKLSNCEAPAGGRPRPGTAGRGSGFEPVTAGQ